MSHSATVLKTDRLILRPPQQADFNDIHAMWSDLAVVRHVTGTAFTKEEAWARLLRSAGHWALMGFGYWVVSEKHSGTFIGEVGFGQYKRGIDPAFDEAPEIGWMLTAESQGQGYGTEAVRAALQWADTRWPEGEIVCIISPENAPSLALARKCLFAQSRTTTYKGKPTVVFQREAPARER
ncbi:GNAT family N-acetyltransferase [Burkholderia sp. S171]|uniref:GNAT family N-acetyltransferase n=1 Tax=Burkholderia sp. S171 TaxID=1641860 RepID=UPI00131CA508|nr:GNAT family N-acetyltransferase [Burkholderia sp. S171]